MSNESNNYPRVLLINGASIGAPGSSGITLSNLFKGWPQDSIAEVYCDEFVPDPEICPRSWPITLKDVPVDRFVRKLLAGREDRILGKRVKGLPSDIGSNATKKKSGGKMRGIAGAWADLLSFRLPEQFWKWIEEFRPEVVYSQLSTIRLMNLVLQTSKRFSLPIVPHFLDDWPTTHYRSSLFCIIPRWILLARLREIIGRSPEGMTISEAMAKEYERRYGIRFSAFVNCLQTPERCPDLMPAEGNRTIKFVYVGGLHLNRWRALEDLGRVLASLRLEGFNVEAEVYAPTADLAAFGSVLEATSTIKLCGSIDQEEVMRVLLSADVLVHVESFEESIRQYVRYSLSTKIPQYMSTGRPILAYGPGEAASCQYISDHQCGITVGRQDTEELKHAVRQLTESHITREDLGRSGWATAVQHHSASIVRENFRSVLLRATT